MSITHQETDAPLLPVPQIERLHAFAPERVEWVFEQTEREAEYRRARQNRVDGFIFAERFIGQVAAVLLCAGALYAAFLLGMAGKEIVASAIGTTAVVGLATAFLSGRKK